MKIRLIILLMLLPLLCEAQEFEWGLQPQYAEKIIPFPDGDCAFVKSGDKWGCVDRTGKWLIEPVLEDVGVFSENMAGVQQNGMWGFVDKTGKMIIHPQFEDLGVFKEDLVGVRQNGVWGFMNKAGNWAIQPQFDDVWSFSCGLARAKAGDNIGFIDKAGKWVIQPQWEDVEPFVENLARVKKGRNYGFIDKTGKWVIESQFDDVESFSDGLALFKQNNKYGFIDKTGKIVIQPQFDNARSFKSGLARIKQRWDYGFIDKTGKWVIEPHLEDAGDFSGNLARVKKDGVWGFINKTGVFVIIPQWQEVGDFENGVAQVQQDNKWGYIALPSISSSIKRYVEQNIAEWQKKGEFEKTADYQKRVNEQSRNAKIQQFSQESLKQLKADYALKNLKNNEMILSEYDADHETYLLQSEVFGTIAVPVPLADAKNFKENWQKMRFANADFSINDNKFQLAKVTIVNLDNSKIYKYDSKQATTYAANNITYNFSPIEVDLPQNSVAQNNTKIENKNTVVGLADVDVNIPTSKAPNPHAYALIIGNEDYSSYQSDLSSEANVDFAVNDATVFKKYCVSIFGVPESNVKFYANATGGQMSQAMTWINKIIQKEGGDAEVIVYYAGHGLPDEKTHEPYIIPVDVSGANIESAIKLQTLYSKLTEFPSKKVTVFMDACFSGGSRGKGLLATRGIKVKPKDDVLAGNIVIFTSSSGEQSSLPFKEKQHGMFTYYLLKKMQDTGGSSSYGDLYDYVRKEVDLNCVKINSKEQTPNLLTPSDLGDNWKGWRLR